MAGPGPEKLKKRFEEWLSKCREVHGEKYDYSEVHFQGASKKVWIRCKTHGLFEQLAKYHAKGSHCPDCAYLCRASKNQRDISGSRFGRLKVLHRVENRRRHWLCECDCGNQIIIMKRRLEDGSAKCCGCSKPQKDFVPQASTRSSRVRDLTGKRFGLLIAKSYFVKEFPYKPTRRGFWNCLCDCGAVGDFPAASLIAGRISSCGCLKGGAVREIVGSRYGRLVVVSKSHSKAHRAGWNCKCDCGNEVIVTGKRLRSGHTQSCGCISSDRLRERRLDIAGEKYSRLTAIHRIPDEQQRLRNGQYAGDWLFQCDCGNTTVTTISAVRSGGTRSCGCLPSGSNTYPQFKDDNELAMSDCCVYLVSVEGGLYKIGISKDMVKRSRDGGYLETFYERWMHRAEARGVEIVALRWTEDNFPVLQPDWDDYSGRTELRSGLKIQETIEMIDCLADECQELGWEEFWLKYDLTFD